MEATTRVEAGDEVQLKVELASDGSGHSLFAEHEPRRAIIHTPKPETYCEAGHITMVPLTGDELDSWADVHKYEFDGETCVKVTNVKESHLE